MSPADRRLRRLLDGAGLGLLVVFPVLCVLLAIGVWLTGN